jgi:hypothetical protein
VFTFLAASAFLPQRVVFANFDDDGDGFGVILRGNASEIINTHQRGLPPEREGDAEQRRSGPNSISCF